MSEERMIEIIREARKILSENDWCQNHFAKKADGTPIMVYCKDACQFCIQGALRRAANGNDTEYYKGTDQIITEINKRLRVNAIQFNDTLGRTKEEVLHLLDNALESFGVL